MFFVFSLIYLALAPCSHLGLDGASGGTGGYAVATSSIVINHIVGSTSAQILRGSVLFTLKFTLGLVFLDSSVPITFAFTAGNASVRTKCSTVGALSPSSWKCLLWATIVRCVVVLVWMTVWRTWLVWLAFEVAECSVFSSGSGISNAEGEKELTRGGSDVRSTSCQAKE